MKTLALILFGFVVIHPQWRWGKTVNFVTLNCDRIVRVQVKHITTPYDDWTERIEWIDRDGKGVAVQTLDPPGTIAEACP